MREPKFRAKRIDSGEWVYGHYFKSPLTDENSGTTPDKGWFFLTGESRHCIESNGVVYVVDPETLGEFTGLHDKNGKEIWEGDIVRWIDGACETWPLVTEMISVVEFVNGQFRYCQKGLNVEVLGNIYENPELLS